MSDLAACLSEIADEYPLPSAIGLNNETVVGAASLCILGLENEAVLSPPTFGRVDTCEEELDAGPGPPSAQLTSIPRLIDQSQVNAKTGVLTRTLRTGYRSGRRAGGGMAASAMCNTILAA